MHVEFTVSAPSLEEVRQKIAKNLETISQAKPEGEYLVDLKVNFSDKHYFSYCDEDYSDDLIRAKEEGNDSLPIDENEDQTREGYMQAYEDGIINELKTRDFKVKYTADVTAIFSDENTW